MIWPPGVWWSAENMEPAFSLPFIISNFWRQRDHRCHRSIPRKPKVMELVKNQFYYLQFQWTIKVIQLKSKSKYAALLRLVHSSQHRTESLRCWSGGNLISTHWKWLKCCRYGIWHLTNCPLKLIWRFCQLLLWKSEERNWKVLFV